MLRISKIILYAFVAVLLLWELPWLYAFLSSKAANRPTVIYSHVLRDFVITRLDELTGTMVRTDAAGHTYTRKQVDSLLPTVYFRQLANDSRFPDSIAGCAVSPRMLQQNNFTFRSSPDNLNRPTLGLYYLFESNSGRVELEMPKDVFRITRSGIEFVTAETNTVDTEKSRRFTAKMREKGFVFPARFVAGNPTPRKDYDEGCMLIDSEGRLFHLKQIMGQPYVRLVQLPDSVEPQTAFVTEYPGRRTLALIADARNQLYAIGSGNYSLTRVGIPSWNPRTESLTIIGNLFDWTIHVFSEHRNDYYAVSADNLELLKTMALPVEDQTYWGLHFKSSTDKYVMPRFN